ncbi:MAG: hypothetical protein WKG00_16355 [Polyangiaceae bacterium]
MSESAARRRFLDNPFHVLGLPKTATRAEVEREGQKLLGMLGLGLASARSYSTPVGPAERDDAAVRQAMAELRDPDKRLLHELWAGSAPDAETDVASGDDTSPRGAGARRWPEARRVLGFGARRSR